MNRIILSTTLVLAATPLVIHGEDSTDNNPNRFFFGPRFGMNFKADFQNKASYFGPVNPGPATGGANHTYNDGYVLVDSSGNAGGLTWNWGYQNSSQYNPAGAGSMQFHAIQSSSSSSTTDDPQYGGEFFQVAGGQSGAVNRFNLRDGEIRAAAGKYLQIFFHQLRRRTRQRLVISDQNFATEFF